MEIGLLYRPLDTQIALALPTGQDRADLPQQTEWEVIGQEYASIGMSPSGHAMEKLRPSLPANVIPSRELGRCEDGDTVLVAGMVVRRQHPVSAKSVFITLEDEFGHIPLIVWPTVWAKQREILKEPYLLVKGRVTRREGTLNVIVERARGLDGMASMPSSRDWR